MMNVFTPFWRRNVILRPQYIISLLVIALLALSSYAILNAAPAQQGPVVPTRRPTAAAPEATITPTELPSATATELPTELPTETTTPTPATPVAEAVRGLSLRGGPSSQYPVVSTLEASQQLDIIGISEDGNWYQVILPDGSSAWVSSSPAMVTTFGNTFNVPLAEPPTVTPTETPTITPTIAATATEAATITPTPTATTEQGVAISITMGSTVGGTIQGQIAENRYSFFGEAGSLVDIRMNNTSGSLDPLLILLDPNGQEIARNDDDPNGLNRDSYIQGFTLPTSGVYTIVATRFQEAQGVSEGSFSLTLSEGSAVTATPTLPAGQSTTVQGSIQGATSEVRYTFEAQAGDIIDIQMVRTSGELDPLLILYGVNGQEIARDDDSGGELNAHISGVPLPATGTYTIAATRFAFLTSEGSFSLTLTLVGSTGAAPQLVPVEAAPTNTIAYGESVQGNIAGQTPDVRYTFTGQAGDVVDIRMNRTGDGDLDPVLTLLGPNGQEVASDDDGGGSRNAYIRNVTLSVTGVYTIVASHFGTSQGDFTLTLTLISGNSPIGATATPSTGGGNSITYGQTVQGSLTASMSEVRYTFTAQPGDVVDIHMNRSGSSLDPLLILLGPNGQEIARDDDGGGSRNAFIRNLTLSAGGTYTIVASSFGNSQGDFSVSLTLVNGNGSGGPPPTPIPGGGNTITYGQTVEGTVPATANGEVRYTFTAQAGDVVEIHMNRIGGGSLDPLLILIGPNGQEIARDDDGGGSRNAYIRAFTIQANGIYTIVATQFGTAGGNFSLTLSR
jgi:uncharacterized protein YdeI (BOF family)